MKTNKQKWVAFPYISILARVIQRNKTNRMYKIDIREDLLLELICTVMEVKESPSLPSANWRRRKADGVMRLGRGGANRVSLDLNATAGEPAVLKSNTWGQEEMDGSAQAERQLSFLHSFILFGLSTDWMVPAHIGEGHLLYSVHQFKC